MRGTVFGFHGKGHASHRHPPKAFSNWDEFLRAGTAPEDRVALPMKPRLPVKARQPVIIHPKTACGKKSVKTSSQPSLETKLQGVEDDLAEEVLNEPRPPCRQSEHTFELEDQVFVQRQSTFANSKEQTERRPIRAMHEELRPPSRHKTPPKAVGLDLPPRFGGELECIDIESMYKDDLLSDDSDDAFASTLPLKDGKGKKHSSFSNAEEAKNGSSFIKQRNQSSAFATSERKPPKNVKKRTLEIPVIFNKRDKKTPAFGTPRRRTRSRGVNDPLEKPQVSARNSKKRNVRAQSSHKSKTGQPLPFFSSLEPEFLDLFAKVDG